MAELTTDQLAASPRLQGSELDAATSKVADLLADLGTDASPKEIQKADALEGGPVVDATEDRARPDATGQAGANDVAAAQETNEHVVEAAGTEQEAADNASPTLPAAYMRSLAAYGWTPDEVDQRLAADPDGFMADAERLHMRRVDETAGWAAEGRRQKDADSGLLNGNTHVVEPEADTGIPDGGLPDIDFRAISEESGLPEDAVRKMFAPVANAVQAINSVLPSLNEGVQHIQQTREEQAAREIDAFFQSPDLKPYDKFYGTSWDAIAPDQIDHRNRVLELADNLIVGANAHGRNLPSTEALELAHASVAKDFMAQAARSEITDQIKQRARSVTLRPTSKSAPAAAPTAAQSREQAIANAGERLRGLFS